MSGIDDLHQSLANVRSAVHTASTHTQQASALLETAQRAIIEPQGQADPWVPAHLRATIDLIGAQVDTLCRVVELLHRYQAGL